MKKFYCTLFINYNKNDFSSVTKESLKVLGFMPKELYVKGDEFEEDMSYDEAKILKLIEKNPYTLWIMNKVYDESQDYFWFRSKFDEYYKILRLEWLNSNLDFLLNSHSMNYFLRNPSFICGYCCDNGDTFQQSQEERQNIIGTDPNDPYKWESVVERIDVSNHWGRSKETCGLEFMAAPIMWFGEPFYKIIPKEKLLEFKYSSLENVEGRQLVFTKLFDVYDSPAKSQNRQRQEEFWKFFDLEKVVNKYKSENEIEVSLEDIIAQARKRKKKK
jgi:hypothetical protein